MLLILVILSTYVLIRIASIFSNYLKAYTRNQHLRFAFGIAAIIVGALHIMYPSFFSHLFSTVFKSTYTATSISGFIQIICGVGLLIRRVYKEAAILLMILLALFIPLSILMMMEYIPGPLGPEYEPVLGYIRILSFPLLIWILFKACDMSPRKGLQTERFNHDI
ncbi:hypothetical protein [Marinifilum caeruleilacunae]|jgi:uncharacterized membrane protein|uniref:DoxX family protein n=1 Tax=Marinifilum caeruleilacunae TaxID=2499076 RepID=A0ABX1WR92_9BACT|nr:hypothetical protein [Marinifilum caeruleilacunae]NOU58602.1 hypothetical protein [Marinifilum caeruleilacunae]